MDLSHSILLALCIAAVIAAGCTNGAQAPVTAPQTPQVTSAPALQATATAAGTTAACGGDTCSFVPSVTSPAAGTSLRIEAWPRRYSPIMSSTPGVGLQPNATGFNVSAATLTWNASYGRFLSWNPSDYTVTQLNATVVNHGEKTYWSFTDRPTTPLEPVIITVTATDPVSGTVFGRSTVTLAWDGDNAVTVKESTAG
jgi:hypothetical protein